ncbi:hypothetical protein [Pleionea sp. CnH1-48]|uniref:hypothetical protein n=1 Tax=Pleionea sp. CnH1-48 TaxID=2954494 RepID=UPI0020972844|nr:hypothetical protein [Pleionea sp. CnH1-48]MCO7226949.1 hypothetical protein [Pleionea sp. CnH1-48]
MFLTQKQLQFYLNLDRNVFLIEQDGHRAWIKKAPKLRGKLGYSILNTLAKALKVDLLKAVPNPGGIASLYNEVFRIEQLHAAGVKVPKIYEKGSNYLLLEDMGTNLRTVLTDSLDADYKLQVMENVFDEVLRLHHKGYFLSQAFSRNIIVDESSLSVGFVDFEDNPGAVLDTYDAQARDLLMLLHSTCWHFEDNKAGFLDLTLCLFEQSNPVVIERLFDAVDQLKWLKKVPAARWLGKDFSRLLIAIDWMSALKYFESRSKVATEALI